MASVVLLNLIMLSVVMFSDIILSVVMLSDIILSVVILSDIILSVVMLSDIILSVVMLSDILLHVVLIVTMLNVILQSVVLPRGIIITQSHHYTGCCYINFRYAECSAMSHLLCVAVVVILPSVGLPSVILQNVAAPLEEQPLIVS